MESDEVLARVKLGLEQELGRREASLEEVLASKRNLSVLYSAVYQLSTREHFPQASIYSQCLACMRDFSVSLVEGPASGSLLELNAQLEALLATYQLGARKIRFVYLYLDSFYVKFQGLPSLAQTNVQMFNQHVFRKVAFPRVFEQLVVRTCGDGALVPFPPTIANQLRIWNAAHSDWTQSRLEIAKRKWFLCRLLGTSSPLPNELIRLVCGLLA